ncbi:VOC family protein [Psychromarinibacter sp. C21-152]|uniref:VOC family protein n=1 Tax=Psychromarinibacter sediminicola TaxID=3033385 RepID=A0AAE3T914_9RHOB|nr:VOC family protein [Psychromarinibacter sediminicola]MDF0600594.1 VOC family protein [Psychromarinibacter sediminicola]
MPDACRLDHIAVSAGALDEGVAYVEAALGLPLAPGGRHPAMGTQNRLLGLGDIYLEVIAIDPMAVPPGRPRWFGLDDFAGRPRPTNWIARTDDLDAALRLAPPDAGTPVALERGDLAWRMAVPADGRLPFDGAFPALMQWDAGRHPAKRLPEERARLRALEVQHPEADALHAALAPLFDPLPITLHEGPFALRVEVETAHGRRVLE